MFRPPIVVILREIFLKMATIGGRKHVAGDTICNTINVHICIYIHPLAVSHNDALNISASQTVTVTALHRLSF